MFKDLKIVKLAVIGISLLYILPYDISYSYHVIDGYSYPFSTTDHVDFYLNTERQCLKNKYKIYAIDGSVVDSVTAPGFPQSPEEQSWKGFGYKKSFTYPFPDHIRPGLYLLDKKVPFLVRTTTNNNPIAVVFPLSTIQTYNTKGGKMLVELNEKTADSVSLSRPYRPDLYTQGLLAFLKKENFNADYITDLDMENKDLIADYQNLLIYGNSIYWTTTAKQNFHDFIKEGGNAVIISSLTMGRKDLYYDRENKMITYSGQHTRSYETTHAYSTSKINGRGYKVYNPAHPLMKGISVNKGDSMLIPSSHYMAFMCYPKKGDSLPEIRRKHGKVLKNVAIAAYNLPQSGRMGIIGNYKISKNSGTITQLGTEKWCLEEYLNTTNGSGLVKNALNFNHQNN